MKTLRRVLVAVAALLLLVLALTGAAWWWSASATSLATSLQQAQRLLGSGQSLQSRGVTGSLREGGHIDWLRWQQGELTIEAHDVTVGWSLRPLLDQELRLGQVSARQVHVARVPSPLPQPTAAPPDSLQLPFKVNAPFAVAQITWDGVALPPLSGLLGNYVFDSKEHRLDITKVAISSGNYQVNARLQAHAPMALSVKLSGAVQTAVPASGRIVTVQAQADLDGTLAGRDAALRLQAKLLPQFDAPRSSAMQASITARIQPWHNQPVVDAQASWQALDLAALWPQAPSTALRGNATVTPTGHGWQAQLTLSNSQSGPWNQQRLPIDELAAKVVFDQGQWTVESLRAQAAGGGIEAHATLARPGAGAATGAAWQIDATLRGIDPAAVDSRLASTVLDGQLTAQQTPAGVQFETDVKSASATSAPPAVSSTRRVTARPTGLPSGMHLKSAHFRGLWRAPLLTLDTLSVQTEDAQLQGRLSLHTLSHATEGQLVMTLPGVDARLSGRLATDTGQGEARVQVLDAAAATRWLGRWPGPASTWLRGTALQGGLDLSGRWQGGWQQQGQAMQIDASLRAPRLDLLAGGADPTQTWRLRALQADLSGTLRALTLSAAGQAVNGTRQFSFKTQAHGGQTKDGLWQAKLDSAQLSAQLNASVSTQDGLHTGLWTLQLADTVALSWQQQANSRSLELSPGSIQLSGPVPGQAKLSWQQAQWSQQHTAGRADWRTQWRSQGTLQDLPLSWLVLFGPTQVAATGLRGDMLFGGQWDASGAEALQVRATLARTAGDLLVQVDDTGTVVQAGAREARLQLTVDNNQLSATLAWDSERGGQAQARFSTSLKQDGGAWQWPADAPLVGSITARLPPVGAWSLLAPPGWRLRGTLDASATLGGTRSAPQWQGSLRAQDLSVRSVVDGFDFSRGSLLARLDGQRLDIVEASLQGAGGGGGGQLTLKGSAVWLPADGATSTSGAALSRVRLELDATAKALRVSTRADRRLVVSGTVSARLQDARLSIRGALTADQALFVLPEDTAPQLGDDVVVRRAPSSGAPNATATAPASPPSSATTTNAITPAAPNAKRLTTEVALTLDPGPDFQVRGLGLATRLAGSLELRHNTANGHSPRLTGELRTVRGTYKAYGQQLSIDQGVLRFNGPYDNPALVILAIRPNLQQRVGAQITGTALSPVVRLYAEPDLPDAEKLSWLVLGRSAASGGAESAMLQQAALALLGGNGKGVTAGLTEAFGLDELSVRGAASNTDGSTGGATVTLGKRLSRDFYVSYERSLTGTLGTLYIFYDLSRRVTVRAQTGEQSAIDLIFTLPYD
ncbi:translocation/assembly module TamB domain-containing protein [Rhodoferax sp.]|uniref:translocation/assembly module TamB domain-containing protein n=1 Tax=Rhodoferax sp. TaxID=50421 RepID=UPI00274E872C|nr:translocation/assembly module TamB domain-containing protein [Rhodoferax sp.]